LNVLPSLTMIVAAAFTFLLARRYMERKKFHQPLWTFGMLFLHHHRIHGVPHEL